MAVKRVNVYSVEIEDTPGSLVGLLEKAAAGGVDFECFTAVSSGHGRGRVAKAIHSPAPFSRRVLYDSAMGHGHGRVFSAPHPARPLRG